MVATQPKWFESRKRSFIISQADSLEYNVIKPYLQKMKSTLDERPEKSSRRTSTRWTSRRSRISKNSRRNDAFAASEDEDYGEGQDEEEEYVEEWDNDEECDFEDEDEDEA